MADYEVVWAGRGSLETREWPDYLRSSCSLGCAAGPTIDDVHQQRKANCAAMKHIVTKRSRDRVPTVKEVRAKVQGIFLDFQRRGDQ